MWSFACNWPWFFGGLLGGWLLWQLFDRFFRRDGETAGMRVRRDLEMANSRLGSLQGEVVAANERLGALRTDLGVASASLKGKADEAAAFAAELTDWKGRFSLLEESSAAAAIAATSAAAAAAAALTAGQDQSRTLQAELDAANALVKSKDSDLTRLTAEVEDWKGRHGGVQNEMSTAEKAATAAAVAAAAALAAASARAATAQSELEMANASLRAAADGQARLSADLAASSENSEKLRADIATLNAGHASLKAELQAAVDGQGTLRTQLSVANDALTTLRSEHAVLNDAHGRLTSELATMSAAHGTLKSEFGAMNDAHGKLKSDHAEVNDARRTITAKFAELNDSHGLLRAELEALRGRHASIEGEIGGVRTSLSQKTDEATRLAAELAACRAEHASMADEMSRAAASAVSARAFASAAEHGFNPRRGGRDDLLIIEGIGPKINELLSKAGIETFARLAAAPVDSVQAILDAAGPNFRLANPASWARQAAMCDAGEWSELRAYQDTLRAGVTAGLSKANEEKMLAAAAVFGFTPRRNGKDDLIIIEGIGPKINELLVNAGIDTFVKLKAAPEATVQAILDAAGPHFRMANPASWSRQAAMCAAGQWRELKALQDSLTAGVDTDRERGA